MVASRVEPGRERGPADGSRRFTPIDFHFDTRANVLSQAIGHDWEPQIKEQWLQNQALVREGLIHQFGATSYGEKIQNYADSGSAPWSVIALHNTFLGSSQTRV